MDAVSRTNGPELTGRRGSRRQDLLEAPGWPVESGRRVTQAGKWRDPRRGRPSRSASSSVRRGRVARPGPCGFAGGQGVGEGEGADPLHTRPMQPAEKVSYKVTCSDAASQQPRWAGEEVARLRGLPGGAGPGAGGSPWAARGAGERGWGPGSPLTGEWRRWRPRCPANQRAPGLASRSARCSVTALTLTHTAPQGRQPRPRPGFPARLPTPDPPSLRPR